MSRRISLPVLSLTLALFAMACGSSDDAAESVDLDDGSVASTDASDGSESDPGQIPDEGSPQDEVSPPPASGRVLTNLSDVEGWASGAFVRQITDAQDIPAGDAVTGRPGDWVIGNGQARFVIQGSDRHSGPCPYGGNVIDAARSDAPNGGYDVMGESCPFIQLGRTLLPEDFEILADGSDGPAILAVTGSDTLLDFINLQSLAQSYIGDIAQLPFDAGVDLPIRITVYYILSGDSAALRVITAIRNDSEAETQVLLLGEILDSGGAVEFFNPSSSKGGFGYQSLNPEPLKFLGFVGDDGSYAVAPDLAADGGPGGSYLAISGVAGIAYGTEQVLNLLLSTPEAIAEDPAAMVLEPGESAARGRWIVPGSGSFTTVTDALWAARGVETGQVTVTVTDKSGAPIAGQRVSLGQGGKAATQGRSGADGTFTARLPVGTWDLLPNPALRRVETAGKVTVEAGGAATASVVMEDQAHLSVVITDATGAPSPGKVSVRCVGPCPGVASPAERDVTFDSLPQGVQAVRFVGPTGKLQVAVPSGEYRVVVSRGPVYSVWPDDDLTGAPVTAVAGEATDVTAEIMKVVPTDGWVSGDLHVHGINSPDSPIRLERRVRSFLAEGVDAIVSTDHDVITDYGPTIAAMGAQELLASVIGEELTTFDYGHFNGFPLVYDPDDLTGGARDWGKGTGNGMSPAEIFAALASDEGEQVVQVNHPENGYFLLTQWDPLTDATYADPAGFRIDGEADPVTGDTGLWSMDFTALEILNGLSMNKFWSVANWWFTLLSRGHHKTATAVSDTHRAISDTGGIARTWAHVGPEHDSPQTFDAQAFAKAINAGAAFGSSGPFVTVNAYADAAPDTLAGLGDTLILAEKGTIWLQIQVRSPRWMRFDRIEVVGNVTVNTPTPGASNSTPPSPLATVELQLPEPEGAFHEANEAIQLEVTQDSWFIVLVYGTEEGGSPVMFPVIPKKDRAFAYTNPIWVDVGGDGWTPLIETQEPKPLGASKPGTRIPRPFPASAPELHQFLDWVLTEHGCGH